MQVLYLGKALHTKETLPDFLKWRRVTRHPLVFRRLTGSQRTPGFRASHVWLSKTHFWVKFLYLLFDPPTSIKLHYNSYYLYFSL